MESSNKIFQALGIPYSALLTIIFGMMLLSFPIGAYLVFNSELGETITYEYPISGLDFFVAGIGFELPVEIVLGDAFVIVWAIFIILFGIAMLGPKKDFFRELGPVMTEGKRPSDASYMVSMLKWFCILILASAIINVIQEGFGIETIPPLAENQLIQFFDITKAPLIEEIGFRVLLVGLPVYAIYSHKRSVGHFFKSLWHPHRNLHVYDTKRAITLIVLVGIFFGIAHILSDDAWSSGKVAQAAVSGIIIGWVYFRHGFAAAVLIHWGTNYFVFFIHPHDCPDKSDINTGCLFT